MGRPKGLASCLGERLGGVLPVRTVTRSFGAALVSSSRKKNAALELAGVTTAPTAAIRATIAILAVRLAQTLPRRGGLRRRRFRGEPTA